MFGAHNKLRTFKSSYSALLALFCRSLLSSEEKCGLPACVIALKISEEVARCFYPLRSLDEIENFWSFSSHFQLEVSKVIRNSLVLICLWFRKRTLAKSPTEQNQTKTCRDSITCVFPALHFFTSSSRFR